MQQIKTGFDLVTTKLQAAAKAIADARQPVEGPRACSTDDPREATLALCRHRPGGWVSAAALDMIPGIFLLLVMMTPRDPALFEQVRRRRDDETAISRLGRPGSASRPPTVTPTPTTTAMTACAALPSPTASSSRSPVITTPPGAAPATPTSPHNPRPQRIRPTPGRRPHAAPFSAHRAPIMMLDLPPRLPDYRCPDPCE